MEATNPPLLDEAAVEEIQAVNQRTQYPYVDALIQTVRAAWAQGRHHYQLWLDLKERHKHKFATADGTWADTCRECGVTTGDDHDGYDCIAWLQRQNTALREQLGQAHDERWHTSRLLTDMQARLAQVEKERPKLTEVEVKVLTDYHYYEADKAITRRGDRAGEREHLERLAIIRATAKEQS